MTNADHPNGDSKLLKLIAHYNDQATKFQLADNITDDKDQKKTSLIYNEDNFVDSLVHELQMHKHYYYQGRAQVSDETYDLAEDILRKLQPDHPFLNSVGYDNQGKALHTIALLSLEKTRDYYKLHAWFRKQLDLSSSIDNKIEISASYKLDGMALSLIYYKGIFFQAKTRGDGKKGEDITKKIMHIKSIPKKITYPYKIKDLEKLDNKDKKDYFKDNYSIDFIEIRGELCCLGSDFLKLKEIMSKKKLDPPSSKRNIVAGLISRKDHLDLCKFLSFFAFDLINYNIYKKKQDLITKIDDLLLEIKKYCKNLKIQKNLIDFDQNKHLSYISSINLFKTEKQKLTHLQKIGFQTAANDYLKSTLSLLSKPKVFDIAIGMQCELLYFNSELKDIIFFDPSSNKKLKINADNTNNFDGFCHSFIKKLNLNEQSNYYNYKVYGELLAKDYKNFDIINHLKYSYYKLNAHFINSCETNAKKATSSKSNSLNSSAQKLQNILDDFKFYAYDIVNIDDEFLLTNHEDRYNFLKDNAFNLSASFNKISQFLVDAQKYRHNKNSELLIDGLVFSYEKCELFALAGYTSHHPKFRMCYKWTGASVKSHIKSIIWDVSRLGFVTPVALIKPVKIGNANIKRVTLHNVNNFLKLNPSIDDEVSVIRAGDIIPRITGLTPGSKNAKNIHFLEKIPKQCPACKGKLEFVAKNDMDINVNVNNDISKLTAKQIINQFSSLRCTNSDNCPPQIANKLDHFCQTVGINDLSQKRLMLLVNSDIVKNISDIYTLDINKLSKHEKMGDIIAKKIIASITDSKNNISLDNFLVGLGICGLQLSTVKKITSKYNKLEKIMDLTVDELSKIDGIGNKSAKIIISSLKKQSTEINKLIELGIKLL